MDPILRVLLALIATLNAATGAPADVEQMPDRPPIVAPTVQTFPVVAATAAPSRTALPIVTQVNGRVIQVQDGQIVVNGQTITLAPDTQISGQLRVGASVKAVVRVEKDGSLEAGSLEVSDDSAPSVSVSPTEKADSQATSQPEVNPTEKPEVKSGGESTKSTDATENKPAATPEIKQAAQPTAQPTEKPEIKSQEKPSGSDDSNKGSGGSGSTSGSTQSSGGDSKTEDSSSGD